MSDFPTENQDPSLRRQLLGHLKRLGLWSGACLAAGIGGSVLAADPARSFYMMTAGWAAVNLLIVAAGLRPGKPLVRAKLREFLWLNQGLNAGYVGVGATMAILGPASVAATGWAVVVQGAALLVLDGVLIRQTGS